MRVEHEGRYAAVASKAGFPRHPVWYFNVKSDPHVELQDDSVRQDMTAREITGDERPSGGSARSPRIRRTPNTRRGPTV